MEGPLWCSPYHPHCPKGGWNWTLGALQSRASCHPRGTRKGPKRMEGDAASHQPLKNEARLPAGPRRIPRTLLLVALLLHSETAGANPHQPAKITWMLCNGLTHEVLNSTTGIPQYLVRFILRPWTFVKRAYQYSSSDDAETTISGNVSE